MPEATQQEQVKAEPNGEVSRWSMEISASRKWMEKARKRGDKIIDIFKNDDKANDDTPDRSRRPYFTANIQTQRALLYGQVPAVDAVRRWADASDDVARVAAEIYERMLNADVEKDGDSFAEAARNTLEDRQLPGIGLMRVRYVAEFDETEEAREPIKDDETGEELAPAVPAIQGKTYECVETEYVHWKDALWSPCKVWRDARWIAFKADMTREALRERFGAVGELVPLNAKAAKDGNSEDPKGAHPWDRAEVWEIWSKEDKTVYWYVEGFDKLLDTKPDPLGLEGFWPCPPPWLANTTTSAYLPTPDYALNQDLYKDIDDLSTRVRLLQQALRVAGVYDKTAAEVQQLLTRRGDNVLIPVEHWAMLAEKGGIKGVIDWFPLDQVVNALTVLSNHKRELVDELHQLTGMSDIMRGEATQAGATATEQRIKAQYGSVRMQALQDEFAKFLSRVQQLKAEIIAKHFDPQTILERANVAFMTKEDQEFAQQAVQLIKSGKSALRVEVKPESVSMADFAAQRQESTETIGALTQFLTAAAPIAQQLPSSQPFLLEMLQAVIARTKGGALLEGILDRAIAQAQQAQAQAAANPQAQQPDPKVMAQQMKTQGDLAKVEAEKQADLQREAFKVQADAQREQNQREQNVMEAAQKQQIIAATKPPPMATPGVAGGRPVR